MKRYRFPLEQVRRVRRVEEDLAKAALLGANRDVAAREEVLDDRQRHLASIVPEPGVKPAGHLRAQRVIHDLAAAAVVAACHDAAAARAAARDRRQDYLDAAARVAALDRLDERRREEHARAAARAEELAVDDLVVSRRFR